MSAALAGCQAFAMGNPLLPRARLQVTALDPLTTVTITPTSNTAFNSTVTPLATRFQLQPVQGDITPASMITAYKVQWFDMSGATISSTLIPVRTSGISVPLARGLASAGGGGGSSSGEIEVPVLSTAVSAYGFDNGFTTDPVTNVAVPRKDTWSQYLTGEVTFSGQDENGWPVVAADGFSPPTARFTLQFVAQASGSAG